MNITIQSNEFLKRVSFCCDNRDSDAFLRARLVIGQLHLRLVTHHRFLNAFAESEECDFSNVPVN